jgi:aspartokinase/homoserine dehydrogenase 1
MAQPGWQVHKFGGTSMGDADCFRRVADILLADPAERQAVVVSAMSKTTDALLGLVAAAEQSAPDLASRQQAIDSRYRTTVAALLKQQKRADEILEIFAADMADLNGLLHSISLVRQAGERSRDLVAGYGELWSSRLLAAYLAERAQAESRDRPIKWVDARDLIVVERGEMGPAVQWDESRARASRHFSAETRGIAVITGFIASEPDGLFCTLGRNGSDFSASIVGALIDAEKITIWTDVDGVMSADPNRVPEATIISSLSYNEAMELAYFGAKVIHPQTMAPAVQRGIPIWIRNTFNTAATGSLIGPGTSSRQPIKGITSVDDVALVNIEGAGMIGVPGTANRLFGVLREASISVILISQASSEHSICIGVPSRMAEQAEKVVRRAFAVELDQGMIQSVSIKKPCSIIAVVGDGMAGIAGRVGQGRFKRAGRGRRERDARSRRAPPSATSRSVVDVLSFHARAARGACGFLSVCRDTLSIGVDRPGHRRPGADRPAGRRAPAAQVARVQARPARARRFSRVPAHAAVRMDGVDLGGLARACTQGSHGAVWIWRGSPSHVQAELPAACGESWTAPPSESVASRYLRLAGGRHACRDAEQESGQRCGWRSYDSAARGAAPAQLALPVRRLPSAQALPDHPVRVRDLRETGDVIRQHRGHLLRHAGLFVQCLRWQRAVLGHRARRHVMRGYTEPDPRDDLSGTRRCTQADHPCARDGPAARTEGCAHRKPRAGRAGQRRCR